MGLDLSLVPDLVKPLARPLTGGAFPETDVDGVIGEARTLEGLADRLAAIKADDAGAIIRMLRGFAWQGAAKEAFEQSFTALGGKIDAAGPHSGEALLDLLEQALRDEAASLREHGVRMQHTEWMIYASLALLGAMIVRLLVWIYVNGPAVLRLIQHDTLLTRVNIQTTKRLVLIGMLKFAGIMGGLDFGVQVAQQIWGDREEGDFDVASLAMSIGNGALTGALFAAGNAGLSGLLSREMVYVASDAELAVRDRIVAISQSMYGQALLGGVAGTTGSIPGLALSGQLDASHLAYTLVSGVAGGLDVPASARVSFLPMRAVAEIGEPAPGGSPHADTASPGGGPVLPIPRAPEHHPPTSPGGDPPPTAGRDTTVLASHHSPPERHADAGSLIDRRPPEPGANLPQRRPGEVIVGEVTRRQDTLPHAPAGDRAEQGGTPARLPQDHPAARTPTSAAAHSAPRAGTATPGSLPRGSLLPATVPAVVNATPDGAARQDAAQASHHGESRAPEAAGTTVPAPIHRERPPTEPSHPLHEHDAPPEPLSRAPREVPAATHLVTSQGDRSSALPADHRRLEPAMKRVTDLLSRDGAYDPLTHAAWDAADSTAVQRLMDTMRSPTKDMLGVGRRQNLQDAIGDPRSDLVLAELTFQGKTIRTWQAVERSSIPSFVESSRSFADGPRRIIRRLPFDSPEAHRTLRRLAVEELLRTWGYGASQMLPQRLAMQMAARDEFGPAGILDLNTYGDRNRNKTARRDHARNEGVLRDFLRQQYEETQRELARRGIEEVVLYRGIAFDPRHPVPSLAEAANGDVVQAPASLPLQSWTTMPGVAKRYTGLGDGAVMAGVFPASQVLSSPWTGLGQLPLNEFVLLATPGEVTVLRPPHVSGISHPDLPAGWEFPKPGDGWTTCEQGHRHWGTDGGTGLLTYHRGPGGDVRVLMQLRSVGTHHGGTWGLPGGARHRGEGPIEAGLREAGEENRLDPREVSVRGVHHDDHGGWAYDTVIGEMSHLADVWPASRESLDNAWVPLEEVPRLNLHPDLARAWPEVRAELDRVLANHESADAVPETARGRTRTTGTPAPRHRVPGLPDHPVPDGFSAIADPRPRNFAEAAATVHRWTPGGGDTGDPNPARRGVPHQDGPANRIERLLSGSPGERAGADPAPPAVPDTVPDTVPDEELLAAGRRLTERLPVTDDSETTARALGSMSRTIGGPDPRRAITDLAAEPGLGLDVDALVTLFDDARLYGRAPDTATDRAALVDILRGAMAADSYRWTGYRNRTLFSLRDVTPTQARTIGLMMRMMGERPTQSQVRNFVQPVLRSHGIRDIRRLLPVVRAAHDNGYFPHGTTGDRAFHAAMDRFRHEDPYLWDGVLLAEQHSLTDLGEAPARVLAILDEIGSRSGVDAGRTGHPLERLAGDAGQGRSIEQLVSLALDAQAHGADLAGAADARHLTGLLTAHRVRDPLLWDGLRLATEHGIGQPRDGEARALARLAEITGSEPKSRLWVFDPLRRLAGDAGLDHSVELLARRAAEAARDGFGLFGPVDRRQVLDFLTRRTGSATGEPLGDLPPGPHDLSPSTVRHARQEAIREHAEAQQAYRRSRPALHRVRSLVTGRDPLAVAEQERVASLEARAQAWQRRPEVSEVSFTRDHAAFRSAYDRAVERAARGEEVIPYLLENATASLAARDGGRGFGLEIEFDLPAGTPGSVVEAIGRALHEAGLTGDAGVHGYHTMKGQGYRSGRDGGRGLWTLERDGTVAGELVSPILFDEPGTWENLRLACEIIRSHGGTASPSTGGHVHVSTHDYDHLVENYTSVLNYFGHHTDTLFRLGHNPERESHRGLEHSRPNELPAAGYEPMGPTGSVRQLHGDRRSAVNLTGIDGSAKDHIEFRLWDGSLDPAVIQSQVKVAVAMVETAFRNAPLDRPPNLGRPDPLGSHAELLKLDPALDRTEQGSLSFRCLMDEIFWRAADKEQLTALYAATRWVRGA